jgi:ubiquinone/menaquinone biosynthesis C-methylase UbiE
MFTSFPLSNRRGINFYVEKTEAAFRTDVYEHYREMVVRQLALHYGDAYWDTYPFQAVLDWLNQQLPYASGLSLLDVGCGVGRLLREVSLLRPDWQLFGIDYSYNLLRSCHQLWQLGQNIEIDYQERGFPISNITGLRLPQLQLGLSKADQLPLDDNSVDIIVNTFLLDRLDEPETALTEWLRVLRTGGRLVVVSPLNWQHLQNWQKYPSADKLAAVLFNPQHWRILDQTAMEVHEPLDNSGNYVGWKARAWSLEKVAGTDLN